MNLAWLLEELAQRTYVMLRPSPIAGVGVFAVRDIPKGCRDMFTSPGHPDDDYISIPHATIAALPPPARHLVENYCLYDEHNYFVPARGFKKLDLVSYLNHSDTPNIISINEGDYFEALTDIPKDTELVVDYGGV